MVAPYRELPRARTGGAPLPSSRRVLAGLAVLLLALVLAAPVVALGMQPFSHVATAVAACLAAFAAVTYARICFSR
jgi:hypothetical protein